MPSHSFFIPFYPIRSANEASAEFLVPCCDELLEKPISSLYPDAVINPAHFFLTHLKSGYTTLTLSRFSCIFGFHDELDLRGFCLW